MTLVLVMEAKVVSDKADKVKDVHYLIITKMRREIFFGEFNFQKQIMKLAKNTLPLKIN